MSALVDTPSKEELKRIEMRKAERSLKVASSEDELSASERNRNQKKRVTFSDQKVEETVQMIDTTSRSPQKPADKKVVTYKGVKIQSDNEGSDENKSEASSKDSAEEYFNQQRKLIRSRMLGDKSL